jgi:Type II CAAX prenyl endopeptidase Rce1-like
VAELETAKTRARTRGTGLRGYVTRRYDPLTSLVLTVPVFLVYHLGILFIHVRNGVDLVSALTFALLEHSVGAYVGVTLGVAGALVGAGLWLRKKGTIRPARLAPVLLESIVLAVVMTLLVGWATGKIFAQQTGPAPLGVLDKIVLAAGAGFHEELVFRVALFAGGAWVLSRLPLLPRFAAVGIAALVSSLVFSGVHYVGSMGDTFTLVSFTFRALSGLYLCAIYRLRGFAVAVYTHALYDLLVFFVY